MNFCAKCIDDIVTMESVAGQLLFIRNIPSHKLSYVSYKISTHVYSKQYNQFINLSFITGSPLECRGSCYIANRRGSADYGPLLRRLSTCNRNFDTSTRRSSLCSSSSEQDVFHRSRSNNSIAMTHVPENVTRMPSGPDGTRGFFGRSTRI